MDRKNFLEYARGDCNIPAIIAIGSAVRPALISIDLDLVVICREPARLKIKPPIEVDLHVYPATQVHSLISSGDDLLGWAVKFGRILFQQQGYWDSILETWGDRQPLPPVDMTVRRAESPFVG
jgi:hypothetical protein